MAIFLHKPILGNFTIVGPLIWCDNPQVRLWMISNINNNDFHHLGKSQICTGADHYFSPSKPHSGKLCDRSHQQLQFLSSLPLSGCPQPSPSSPSECSYQWQQWLYYSKYFPSLWYHVPSITMNFARKRIRSFLNSSGSGMIGSRPGFIRSQYKI